jgi:lysozyme
MSWKRGIDLSHHNPNPDFSKAKAAGITFVYIKATEGKT